jgi:glucose/arabinose dehydrogenase
LAFDPVTGDLWDTENGPSSYDEINRVEAGFNSGWFELMGPDSRDPGSSSNLVVLPGSAYSDPEFSWLSPIGVTSIEFLADSNLHHTYGDGVIVGNSNLGTLYYIPLNANRDGFDLTGGLADLVADNSSERNSLLFGEQFGVVTDIKIGPENAVYVLSLSGSLYRVVPEVSPTVLVGLAFALAIPFAVRRKLQRVQA